MNTELFLAIHNLEKAKVESLLPILTLQDSNEGVYCLFKKAMYSRENEASYAKMLLILLKKFPETEVNRLAAFVDGQPLEIPYLDINEEGKDSLTVYDNVYDLSIKRIDADPSHTVLVPSKEVKRDGVMDRLPQGTCRIIRDGLVQDYTKFYPSTPLMIAVSFELVNMMNALLKYSKVDVSISTLAGGVWDVNHDRKSPGVISIEKRLRKRAIDFPTKAGIREELEKIHISAFVQEGMTKKSTEKERMLGKYEYKVEHDYFGSGPGYLELVCDYLEQKTFHFSKSTSLEEMMQDYEMWETSAQDDSLLFSVLESKGRAEKIRSLIYHNLLIILQDSSDLRVKGLIQHLSMGTVNKVIDEIFFQMKHPVHKVLDKKYVQIIKAILHEFPEINLNSEKKDFHLFELKNKYDDSASVVYDKCTYFMIAHRYQFQEVMNFLLSQPEIDVSIPIEIEEQRYTYDRDYDEYNLESKRDKYNNYYTCLKSKHISRDLEKIRQAHIKQFTREAILGKAEDMEKLLKKHEGVDLTPKEIRVHLTKQIMERVEAQDTAEDKIMVLDAEKRNLPTNNALASFLGNERDILENTLSEQLITLIKSKAIPAGATSAPTKNFAGAGDEKAVAINSGDAGPSTQASRWSKLFN